MGPQGLGLDTEQNTRSRNEHSSPWARALFFFSLFLFTSLSLFFLVSSFSSKASNVSSVVTRVTKGQLISD